MPIGRIYTSMVHLNLFVSILQTALYKKMTLKIFFKVESTDLKILAEMNRIRRLISLLLSNTDRLQHKFNARLTNSLSVSLPEQPRLL